MYRNSVNHLTLLAAFGIFWTNSVFCSDKVTKMPEAPLQDISAVTYEAAWFNRFTPNSAADILQFVPSFKSQATDAERGIGQTAENVLINGKPVKGKGANALALLKGIPAEAVIRVEVKDAASYDISGLSGLVANVIVKRQEFQGTWKWSPEYRRDVSGRTTNTTLSFAGHLDSIEYSVGIANNSSREGDSGNEDIFTATEVLTEQRNETFTRLKEEPTLSVDIVKRFSPTFISGLNTNIKLTERNTEFISYQTPVAGIEKLQVDTLDENALAADITLRTEKTVGLTQYDLIIFQSYEDKTANNYSLTDSLTNNATLSKSAFDQEFTKTESIVRGAYKQGTQQQFWEISGELAYNRLNANSLSGSSQAETPLTRSVATDATGKIEENRAEIFISQRFSVDNWIVDASLGTEFSVLKVSALGGNREELTRRFVRPKGQLSGTVPIANNANIRLGIERKVDQIDFFNFLGAADFRQNRSTGSNSNLLPSQSWQFNSELENRFGLDNKLTSRVKYIWHEDIVGRRVIDKQDAIGNIGNGQQWVIESELNWRPSSQRLRHWQVNLNGGIEGSDLTDPVTGNKHPFSESKRWSYRAELIYQMTNKPISFGITAEHSRNNQGFLSDETFYRKSHQPFTFAYIKHGDMFGLNLSVYLFNLLNAESTYDREIYSGFRNEATIQRIERLSETYGPFLTLDIQGSF